MKQGKNMYVFRPYTYPVPSRLSAIRDLFNITTFITSNLQNGRLFLHGDNLTLAIVATSLKPNN